MHGARALGDILKLIADELRALDLLEAMIAAGQGNTE